MCGVSHPLLIGDSLWLTVVYFNISEKLKNYYSVIPKERLPLQGEGKVLGMLLFYLRHGDPIYDPDSLTVLGEKQAEALAKRLSLYGIDKVFASTSNRAIMTAQPTCDLLHKKAELLDFCNEGHAWDELTVQRGKHRYWIFHDEYYKQLFTTDSIRQLSHRWYEHPELREGNYGKGINRIYDGTDEFLLSLGYEHERYTGRYKVIRSNEDRVALFAHHGFGIAFLSCLLDIPYPQFGLHFDICHTGMTVIEFEESNGYVIPRILTLSSDSHLYREGLPTSGFGVRF